MDIWNYLRFLYIKGYDLYDDDEIYFYTFIFKSTTSEAIVYRDLDSGYKQKMLNRTEHDEIIWGFCT